MAALAQEIEHYVYTLAYPESMGGYVFYVGKGVGNRIDDHEREARQEKSHNLYKCRVIRSIWSQGEQIVKEKVAFFETHKEALQYEEALIMLMRPYGHLTNATDGGEGMRGYAVSEETRRKMSKIHKGRVFSSETRRKFSEAAMHRTEEHQRKLSGKHRTEEARHKMSEAAKGRIHTEETRRKMSEARKGKGHTHTEEARRKISAASKKQNAQQREQRLLAMRYPVISATDAAWKQGLAPLSLWEAMP